MNRYRSVHRVFLGIAIVVSPVLASRMSNAQVGVGGVGTSFGAPGFGATPAFPGGTSAAIGGGTMGPGVGGIAPGGASGSIGGGTLGPGAGVGAPGSQFGGIPGNYFGAGIGQPSAGVAGAAPGGGIVQQGGAFGVQRDLTNPAFVTDLFGQPIPSNQSVYVGPNGARVPIVNPPMSTGQQQGIPTPSSDFTTFGSQTGFGGGPIGTPTFTGGLPSPSSFAFPVPGSQTTGTLRN